MKSFLVFWLRGSGFQTAELVWHRGMPVPVHVYRGELAPVPASSMYKALNRQTLNPKPLKTLSPKPKNPKPLKP